MRESMGVGDLATIGEDLEPWRVRSWYIDTTPAGDGLYHVHLRRETPALWVDA